MNATVVETTQDQQANKENRDQNPMDATLSGSFFSPL